MLEAHGVNAMCWFAMEIHPGCQSLIGSHLEIHYINSLISWLKLIDQNFWMCKPNSCMLTWISTIFIRKKASQQQKCKLVAIKPVQAPLWRTDPFRGNLHQSVSSIWWIFRQKNEKKKQIFFSLPSFHFEKQMKAEQESFHCHSVPTSTTRNGSQRNQKPTKTQGAAKHFCHGNVWKWCFAGKTTDPQKVEGISWKTCLESLEIASKQLFSQSNNIQ